jgi:hypothetical protein
VTNVSAALFFAWLLFQRLHGLPDPLLRPEMILLILLTLMANIVVIRGRSSLQMGGEPSALPMAFLAAGYALGFAFIVLYMIVDFHWWELLLLFVPGGLFALNIRTYRRRRARYLERDRVG